MLFSVAPGVCLHDSSTRFHQSNFGVLSEFPEIALAGIE
ncbi:hypothetical protein Enr17x_36510 [Gimesia fumaroli]|uniref:Uncharacterized protein n=1 Tax=Gimesia fumaroli TaxID=2527976 RepID=A0A518IET3_9PLAN|nr:hypothetical protein Enr17x_36510 [Gimesia fumaroli]